VVHPFHPLAGQEFELIGYAHTWGEHRVFFREDHARPTISLPASWTDVQGMDPFATVAAGRSRFRVDDLLQLVQIVRELEARSVREILP
jgi:hypothetical protein